MRSTMNLYIYEGNKLFMSFCTHNTVMTLCTDKYKCPDDLGMFWHEKIYISTRAYTFSIVKCDVMRGCSRCEPS